jgi:hypothetical protein
MGNAGQKKPPPVAAIQITVQMMLGTRSHETPCDRRHTDVLAEILTTRLGAAW